MQNIISDELYELMIAFAVYTHDFMCRSEDPIRTRDCLDEYDEVARRLLYEYNVFAQVRMLESAVFYAGENAWRDNLEPFAIIPFSELKNHMASFPKKGA